MTNPITEANPSALDELFSRDPLGLADVDLDVLVAELQRMRLSWEQGKPAAKAKGASPKAKTPKTPPPSLSLEDLGI